MPIHLGFIHGYFQATMAEMNGCNQDQYGPTKPKICDLALSIKSFPPPDPEYHNRSKKR